MKKIFGFVGHIASGKGAACDYLGSRYNAGYHRYSSILRDLVGRLYLPTDRDHLIRISEVLRSAFGEDTLARVIKEDVERDTHDVVCVDGIRRLADIAELRKLPGFTLVYIEAAPQMRFNRLIQRTENEDDQKKTFEDFLKDEERSTEKSIDDVAVDAHITINNDGSIDDLHATLDKLVAA